MNPATLTDLRVPIEVVLGGAEFTAEQLAGMGLSPELVSV